MPKISRRTEGPVRTEVVKGPRAQGLPAAAFGDAQLIKGAADVAKSFAGMKDRIDTTMAEEGMVKFERAKNDLFFNPDSGYFKTQGKNAYDSSTDVRDALTKLAKSHADTMPSARSKQMFNDVANLHITSGETDIMRHATKGFQAWEVATVEAQSENALEGAALNWNDPEKLRRDRALGRDAVKTAAKMQGITGEALNERYETYESAFASQTIDAAMQHGSTAAEDALKNNRKRLEGGLADIYDNKIASLKGEEQEQSQTNQAITVATRLFDKHEGDRTKVLEDLKGVEDDAVRQEALKEASRMMNEKDKADLQYRTDANEAAEADIYAGGSVAEFKLQNKDQWGSLTTKQKRTLEAGRPPQNNWNDWHDVMSKSPRQIREMTPNQIEKAMSNLDAGHRDKLYTMWKKPGDISQVGRSRAMQTRDSVASIINKKKFRWNDDDRKKTDRLYSLFDDELRHREEQLGRDLDSDEYTNMLANFTNKAIIEGFIFDTEKGVEDIPEEHYGAIAQNLRDNNIAVTAPNMLRRWEEVKP